MKLLWVTVVCPSSMVTWLAVQLKWLYTNAQNLPDIPRKLVQYLAQLYVEWEVKFPVLLTLLLVCCNNFIKSFLRPK